MWLVQISGDPLLVPAYFLPVLDLWASFSYLLYLHLFFLCFILVSVFWQCHFSVMWRSLILICRLFGCAASFLRVLLWSSVICINPGAIRAVTQVGKEPAVRLGLCVGLLVAFFSSSSLPTSVESTAQPSAVETATSGLQKQWDFII